MASFLSLPFLNRDSKESGNWSPGSQYIFDHIACFHFYLAVAPGLTWTWSCLVSAHDTAVEAITTAAEVEISMKAGEREVTKLVLF